MLRGGPQLLGPDGAAQPRTWPAYQRPLKEEMDVHSIYVTCSKSFIERGEGSVLSPSSGPRPARYLHVAASPEGWLSATRAPGRRGRSGRQFHSEVKRCQRRPDSPARSPRPVTAPRPDTVRASPARVPRPQGLRLHGRAPGGCGGVSTKHEAALTSRDSGRSGSEALPLGRRVRGFLLTGRAGSPVTQSVRPPSGAGGGPGSAVESMWRRRFRRGQRLCVSRARALTRSPRGSPNKDKGPVSAAERVTASRSPVQGQVEGACLTLA